MQGQKSVISVALKTPLEIKLGICIHKTSLLHQPNDHISFTPSCPPHILQQNCAHGGSQTGTIWLTKRVIFNSWK